MQEYGRQVLRNQGGYDAFEWVEDTLPPPGAGEISVAQEAVGVDMIDTQFRAGRLPLPLPSGLGFGAAGRVIAVGAGVEGFQPGDSVAYHWSTHGSYAEARNIPAERAYVLPEGLAARQVAGAILRGLTAWYLTSRMRPIAPGDHVLVHAAAGGVGVILCQWLAHLGAIVIGTTGSPEKLSLLEGVGCQHALLIEEGWAEKVRALTGGKGCAVVYDSVGKDTFDGSLDCAARFGLVVSYGWASGDVEPVSLNNIRNKGSLFVTRPTVAHYTANPADLREGLAAFFGLLRAGHIILPPAHEFPLREAGEAHRALVERRTTGPVTLIV